MKKKADRLSPMYPILVVYICFGISATQTHGCVLGLFDVMLSGVLWCGVIIALIRIVKLIGKEWISPFAGMILLAIPFILIFI